MPHYRVELLAPGRDVPAVASVIRGFTKATFDDASRLCYETQTGPVLVKRCAAESEAEAIGRRIQGAGGTCVVRLMPDAPVPGDQQEQARARRAMLDRMGRGRIEVPE